MMQTMQVARQLSGVDPPRLHPTLAPLTPKSSLTAYAAYVHARPLIKCIGLRLRESFVQTPAIPVHCWDLSCTARLGNLLAI